MIKVLAELYNSKGDFIVAASQSHFRGATWGHAETNAIILAKLTKEPILNGTIVISGLPPCEHCMKSLVTSGITTIKVKDINARRLKKWKASCIKGLDIIKDIKRITIDITERDLHDLTK